LAILEKNTMRENGTANRQAAGILFATVAVVAGGIAGRSTVWANDAVAPAISVKSASVFGFTIHYREAGHGPIVILLHGLGGDSSRWLPTMTALAGEYRLIAPDQIGFGQSEKPLVNYNHGLLAEFLGEFLRTIGVSKASLVGHSMGGYVAMHVALHSPEMVERLVLVDGGGIGTNPPRSPHLVRIQNGTTLAETREYFELLFHDKSRVTDELVRENYRRRLQVAFTISKMQEARANNVAIISHEQAARITAPTLIVWGQYDALLPPTMAEVLRRAIPNSRVALIDKAGHLPQVEQPEQFHRLLREFLWASAQEEKGTALMR